MTTVKGVSPSSWSVRSGPSDTANVDSRHETVTEAIRAAAASGQDVWLHADDCTAIGEMGGGCPCRPVLVAHGTSGVFRR